MADALRLLAARFFASQCPRDAPAEEEVIEYTAQALADGECDVDTLCDVISGFVPTFAELCVEEREARVVALLDEALTAKSATAEAVRLHAQRAAQQQQQQVRNARQSRPAAATRSACARTGVTAYARVTLRKRVPC